MICGIEDFIWRNNKEFSWIFHGKQNKKKFKLIPQSVIELAGKSGFAVVGSNKEFGEHNAFIINANGSKRVSLIIPVNIKNPICFHEIYYINEELTAIIATQGVDFACVIDSNNGQCIRIYETR